VRHNTTHKGDHTTCNSGIIVIESTAKGQQRGCQACTNHLLLHSALRSELSDADLAVGSDAVQFNFE
jgi:hypothetical protein